MSKSKPEPKRKPWHQYTVRLVPNFDARVRACMELEGVSNFADFARSSLAHRCRAIERDHGSDKPKSV